MGAGRLHVSQAGDRIHVQEALGLVPHAGSKQVVMGEKPAARVGVILQAAMYHLAGVAQLLDVYVRPEVTMAEADLPVQQCRNGMCSIMMSLFCFCWHLRPP